MSSDSNIVLKWPSGQEVIPTQSSGTVLEAMLGRGVPIAHSCRRGDCRQCTARLLESASSDFEPGAYVQLCSMSASLAGVFQLAADPYQAAASVRTLPAKVVEVTEAAKHIVRLRVRVPPKRLFDFRGGQYALLTVDGGLSRSYSIASANTATGEIDFYIKIVHGGAFGGWLTERASPGALLQMRAPQGAFTFQPVSSDSVWFVATGTGVVPIFAMLKEAGRDGLSRFSRAELVWGNRTRDEIFRGAEFAKVCRDLGINLRTVFSREVDGASRVTDILARSELAGSVVYCAGHPEMVQDVQQIWARRSFASGHFFSDAFAFSERGQALRAAQ
jgi:ferredoxin-NADP reductase/ferredoxin